MNPVEADWAAAACFSRTGAGTGTWSPTFASARWWSC